MSNRFTECECCNDHQEKVSEKYGASLRTINYAIVFSGDLKTSGQNIRRDDVIKGISDALNRYSEVSNVEFIKSGSPRFTIRIQSHPVDAAGIQNGSSIYLNTRDPRGWPVSKITKITAHEVWHYLFGSSHDYRTYNEDGTTHNALMHPYSNPPMWLFAPWEESMLVRRFGKVAVPEPEPEPEPEPPMPNPIEEELKELKIKRKEQQSTRDNIKGSLAGERIRRDKALDLKNSYNQQVLLLNTSIQSLVANRNENELQLKKTNARIEEIRLILKESEDTP